MINQFIKSSWGIRRLEAGPLGQYAAAYTQKIAELGYSPGSMRQQILLLVALNEWLKKNKVKLRQLDQDKLTRFVADRKRKSSCFVESGGVAALKRLTELLHGKGAIPIAPLPETKRSPIEEEYSEYLLKERCLSQSTEKYYLEYAHQFIIENKVIRSGLEKLTASDVTDFIRRHARDGTPKRAQLMVTSLRSFFRFLRLHGDILRDLADCIPPVANWQLAGLPKFMEPADVKTLLKHCDRKTPKGLRDYALLLLIARLGLRACEVVALSLDDIDWESGKITIHGKGTKRSQFPLPQDVGMAIANYLRSGRPQCPSRSVFLRTRAPLMGFVSSVNVSSIVSRTLKKAGLNPPCKGAHLLRHTAAVQILRRGSSLSDVGEILRHRNINTTAIYAKVDVPRLKKLAMPWPNLSGGAR